MMWRLAPYAAVAACVVASLSSRPAEASWPSDPLTNLPICTATGNQDSPVVVADGHGGAIFGWYDHRNGADYDIYAAHVLASGIVDPAWPANGRAICVAAGDQQHPAIVTDGNGGAILSWHDSRNGSANYDIYAQHVLSNGTVDPAWPSGGQALCSAAGLQEYPTIVADGSGGAIVAWYDMRNGVSFDIYAQHVLASGAVDPVWPVDGRALCSAANNQFSPIAADGAGGAIVTWYDFRSNVDYDIYAQHVSSSGTVDPAWPTDGRALCTAPSDQYAPTLVADGAGGAIVAWFDNRSGLDYDIYAQHVSASGTVDPTWPVNGRGICTATGDQQYPTLVTDGSGGAIVTWEDLRGADADIYAQHVLASGAVDPAWPVDGRTLCTATGDQQRPVVVSDLSGGAIAVWFDIRNGSNYDIYGQHVMSSGAIDAAWPTDGRAVCTAGGTQSSPTLTLDGAGGVIVAWRDLRNGTDYDIYAQRVGFNGQLGGGSTAVPIDATHPLALEPIRPNPSSGRALSVGFSAESASATSLELVDVTGRVIAEREVGSLGSGRHTVDLWRGQRLTPGVYLVRLQQGGQLRTARVVVVG